MVVAVNPGQLVKDRNKLNWIRLRQAQVAIRQTLWIMEKWIHCIVALQTIGDCQVDRDSHNNEWKKEANALEKLLDGCRDLFQLNIYA
jgi:hypothetical protein